MIIYRELRKLSILSGKIVKTSQIKAEKPKASEVLTDYINQCNEPPWTSYFVKRHLNQLHYGMVFSRFTTDDDNLVVKYVFKFLHIVVVWGFPILIKYNDVKDDQWGKSHFNWKVGNSNYHILRAGCYPYIKYHCTKRKEQDLSLEDSLFRFIKVFNLGIPLLAYGIAATQLITHSEIVNTSKGPVNIYFLYEENKGSQY